MVAAVDKTRWDALLAREISIPLNEALGFVNRGGPGRVVFSWEIPRDYCNSAGNLQGGMLAAFADAALGGAAATELSADSYPVLVEMSISIVRAAAAGTTITATGRVLKAGRRVLFTEAEITDGSGKLIAKATGTAIPAEST